MAVACPSVYAPERFAFPAGSRKKKDGFIHNRACIERRMRVSARVRTRWDRQG